MTDEKEVVGFEVLSPDENGIIDVYKSSIPEEDKPIKVKIAKPVKERNPNTSRIVKGIVKTIGWVLASVYCIYDVYNMAHGYSFLLRFTNYSTGIDILIVMLLCVTVLGAMVCPVMILIQLVWTFAP